MLTNSIDTTKLAGPATRQQRPEGDIPLTTTKLIRAATIFSLLGLPILASGCSQDSGQAEHPGGKATAATEKGGGETTEDPGGPNVRPDMGTPPVSR
jgi:hypothetical protein